MCVGVAVRCHPGGRDLRELSDLHQLVDGHPLGRREQGDPGFEVGAQLADVGGGDEGPAGDPTRGVHQVLAGERADGLPDGALPHSELGPQLGVGR